MKKTVKDLIFVFFAGLTLTAFFLPDRPNQNNIEITKKLDNYYTKYPQQKVYLHLDKHAYQAGDIIWFKAYFLDAMNHQPSNISKNLIVELINSFGRTVMTRLIKMENGLAHGDFPVSDTLSEGIYEIRAYTNWMRNFGDHYFYRKYINIWNSEYAPKIYKEDKIANRRLKKKSIRKAEKIDIQFFPEGGYMVYGINSRLAFKAINELGLGVSVQGEIVDSKNKVISDFESSHLGMGTVYLNPEKGSKYKAVINTENNRTYKFKLPEPLEEGYVMTVDNLDEREMQINITSSYTEAEVLLVGHVRGKVFYTEPLMIRDNTAITTVLKDKFPSGIVHLTLFDKQNYPQCERLTFINHHDQLNMQVTSDKSSYGIRDKVILNIRIKDQDGNPVEGNFSVSVADRTLTNNSGDFQTNIISYLLLTSDLKGQVENPEYYFKSNTKEVRQKLDYLLLTQGWRRFVWKDVLETNFLEIKYPIERGLSVTGRITREFFDIPLKNLPVTLTVLSEFNDVYVSRTDEKGRFKINLPDYQDTIYVELTARRLSGRKNLVIYVDETDLPQTRELYTRYTKEMTIQGSNIYRPVEEKEEDTNQVKLKGIYSSPDNVIYVDETLASYNSVFEILQGRVPGVQVTGNRVVIRGPSSFYLSNDPLYLIDNIPVDANAIESLNPHDVERIEVLKGPSTAIFGSRGANGVIAVFTKRGRYMKKGVLDFKMLGYQRPREFYSPKYGTEFDYLIPDNRSTLFWEPDVTTDANGNAELTFFNSDKKGRYFIVLEGLSEIGQIGHGEDFYDVN